MFSAGNPPCAYMSETAPKFLSKPAGLVNFDVSGWKKRTEKISGGFGESLTPWFFAGPQATDSSEADQGTNWVISVRCCSERGFTRRISLFGGGSGIRGRFHPGKAAASQKRTGKKPGSWPTFGVSHAGVTVLK